MTRPCGSTATSSWPPGMELREISACDAGATGLRGARGIGGGRTYVMPRKVTLPIEMRNPVDDLMTAAEQRLASHVGKLANQHCVQEISAICPTAMVFVARDDCSISHTFREYSNSAACGNGADVLANAVLRLADQP